MLLMHSKTALLPTGTSTLSWTGKRSGIGIFTSLLLASWARLMGIKPFLETFLAEGPPSIPMDAFLVSPSKALPS